MRFNVLLLLALIGVVSAVNVNTCLNLSTASTTYDMIANINGAGTCINITAASIIFDCHGFSINATTGIEIQTNNVVVKNCNISSAGNGIHGNIIVNATIRNTTINGSGNGIYLSNNNNSIISNNTINVSTGTGVKLEFCRNNIVNSTIANSSAAAGFQIECGNSNFTNIIGVSNSYFGIITSGGSFCSGNIFINATGNSISYTGFYLNSAQNDTFANSIGTSNSAGHSGIYIASSNYNNFINSTGIGIGVAIRVSTSNYNNITNSTGISTSNAGLLIVYGSSYNRINNSKFIGNDNTYGAISIFSGSNTGNIIENSTMNGMGKLSSLNIQFNGDNYNNSFIGNSIFNATNLVNLSALYSHDNVFLRNNLTNGTVWIVNGNETNMFNDSLVGNIYYLANGVPSSNMFNIIDTNANGYADTGSAVPFNATTIGGNWSGAGGDWHPAVITTYSINSTYTLLPSNVSDLFVYPVMARVNTSGLIDVNATLTIGSSTYIATKTLVSYDYNLVDYIFTAQALPPEQPNGTQTNYSPVWNFSIATLDGNVNNLSNLSQVTVFRGGLTYCSGNYSIPSLNITARIEGTVTTINATEGINSVYSTPRARTQYLTATNDSVIFCVAPTTSIYYPVNTLVSTATGYNTRTNIFTVGLNATMQDYFVSLVNSTVGGYYTFTVVDQLTIPISQATIVISRINPATGLVEIVEQASTNPDGTATFFFVPLQTYIVNVSKSGYTSVNFNYVPASVTTLQIKLFSVTGGGVFTDYKPLFADISTRFLPINTRMNQSTNISFSIISQGGHLSYFGWTVQRIINGSYVLVASQNVSGNASGGTVSYTVATNATGSYVARAYFKHADYDVQEVSQTYVYISSRGIGVSNFSNLMSGWSYLFLTTIIVMLTVGFLMRYTAEGAALGGLIVFWFFALMNPSAAIYSFYGTPLTMIMVAILTSMLVIAAWIIKGVF